MPLRIYDGARMTLGDGPADAVTTLKGNYGFSISQGASAAEGGTGEREVLEVLPTAPNFFYVFGRVVHPEENATELASWWFPCYSSDADARLADAAYRNLDASSPDVASHPAGGLEFDEYTGVRFFVPSIFCLQGNATVPENYTFDDQLGYGTVYVEPGSAETLIMPDDLVREVEESM